MLCSQLPSRVLRVTRSLIKGCITVTQSHPTATLKSDKCGSSTKFSQPRQGSKILRSRQGRSNPENRDVECGMWSGGTREGRGGTEIGCAYSFPGRKMGSHASHSRPAAPDEFKAVMRAKEPGRQSHSSSNTEYEVPVCHLSSNIGNISPQRVTR
jgi:hypothetical protein